MCSETIALLTMIGTLLSAVAALIAAYAAMKTTKSWKEEKSFESRRSAVNAWIGGATIFRGRLKFIYKQQVKWPDDQKEIEYISEHFWNWIALWPSVRASLDGDLKVHAELLWGNVFESYSAFMSNSDGLERLAASVEAVYNSDLLNKVLKNQS